MIIKNDELPFVGLPRVTIAGFPIPQQTFRWCFTTGVEPYTTTFVVPREISEQLDSVINPVSITISFPTKTGTAQDEPADVTIYNAYLVGRKFPNLAMAIWTIADARWLLQGKKIYSVYNKTLIANDNKTAFNGDATDQSSLRTYWEKISIGRYVPWTIKKDGKPYTMREIVEVELAKLGIEVLQGVTNDLAYYVDNIIIEGMDAARTMEEYLSLTKDGMSINADGKIYIYSLNSLENNLVAPIQKLREAKVANGALYAQNKKKARPKKINVLFEKKMETMLVAMEDTRQPTWNGKTATFTEPLRPQLPVGVNWWNNTDLDEVRVIGCINVLPVPYPVSINGIPRNPGEFVPVVDYLRAFGTDESFMYEKSFFNGGFEIRFLLHLKNFWKVNTFSADQNRLAYLIASTVREHWRKTYQIDPFYLDQIKKWEARMVSIINMYDRHPAPSPIFGNYFYVPFARTLDALTQQNWASDAFSWEVTENDPYLFTPSPAMLGMVSPGLGVFSVEYKKPLDVGTSMTGNFAISPLPNPSPDSPSFTLDFCFPKKNHTMLTIVSVVWHRNPKNKTYTEVPAVDPDRTEINTGDRIRSQYYVVPVYAGTDAEFPSWDVSSTSDYARYALPSRTFFPSGLGKWFGPGYKLLLDAIDKQRDNPLNSSFLSAIANYEAGRIYNQFVDLYAGSLTVPGVRTDIIVCGNLARITIELSTNGATTKYDFIDVTPYASIESRLPQRYINFLRGNITRSDEINYMHVTM